MTGTESLFRLAYISTRAEGVDDSDVVDGIAIPAMSKNRRLDITGCLWISSDRFVQVLEGGENIVRDLYGEIQNDPRHTDVGLLVSDRVSSRRFERFSLRVIRADGPESIQNLITAHSERREFEPVAAVRGASAMGEFTQLVYRVIDDLASWAVDPPDHPRPSLA